MAQFAKQALAQNINVVSKFDSSLKELLAVLGKSDVTILAPGTTMKIYTAAGMLPISQAGEAQEIEDARITMEVAKTVELTYSKFRNLTSVEPSARWATTLPSWVPTRPC